MTRTEEALALSPRSSDDAASLSSAGYLVASRKSRAMAWFDARGLEVFTVLGLSPRAIWLEALPAQHARRGVLGEQGRLWLECEGHRIGPLAARLCPARLPDWLPVTDRTTAVATLPGSLAELRELAAYIHSLERAGLLLASEQDHCPAERIADPREICEILDFLARQRVQGLVQTDTGPRSACLVSVDARRSLLHWHGQTEGWSVPTTVDFACAHSVYRLPLTEGPNEGGVNGIPRWIMKSSRRGARRTRLCEALSIGFTHPLAPELQVEGHVRDLSRSGVSFETDVIDHLLYPGLEIPSLELQATGGSSSRYRGLVRNCRLTGTGRRSVVGVSLEPSSADDAALLERLLEPALYPCTLGSAADVWSVFEASGYLKLSGKRPGDFQHLHGRFVQVAQKLERARDVGSVAHWPAHGPIQATVSHLKTYQSSWLLCQVSKLKGAPAESRLGLQEMYLRIYESAQADPDTRWLLVYVQDDAPRWSRELHVTLPERYAACGEACLVPFRALESRLLPSRAQEPGHGVRVTTADPVTARAAMRDLHRVRPAQYLDALDLTEGRCNLASVRARWNAAGLERDRQLLIAYEGSIRCALAVVEVAEQGSHLYGLLDCLRMYPLRPGGERAFGALLRTAHRWFGEHGREHFVYLEEYPGTLPTHDLGFHDMGGATFTILSIDRMPELMQRTADLASQRPPAATAAE